MKEKLLRENIPLICILIGVVLVSASIGPYENLDTGLEYGSTLEVVTRGMPYSIEYEGLINQPPLGFYVPALILKAIGSSYNTAVAIVTLFGLGCTIMVYAIGKELYDKLTGIFAAAIFAMTPWQIVLSRSFLIDIQCLLFSLLTVLVGIHAIRKDSFKMFMTSATLFALALLTKLYAVFALIPLAIFYFYFRQKNLNRKLVLTAYAVPALLLFFLWYQIIAGEGFFSVLGHNDFWSFNPPEQNPSFWFVTVFLLSSLGLLFLPTTALSTVVGFFGRKKFPKHFSSDLICIITIVAVGNVNTVLGYGLNLYSPYISPIKYDYQFLPFFSLLAASLVSKYRSIHNSKKQNRALRYVTIAGLILLIGSLVFNMLFIHMFSMTNYVVFSIKIRQDFGYSFFNSAQNLGYNALVYIQLFGFALVIAALVLASINKFGWFHKTTH